MGSGQGRTVDSRDPPRAGGRVLASPWIPQPREGRTAPAAWWGSDRAGGQVRQVGPPTPPPKTRRELWPVSRGRGSCLPAALGPCDRGVALPPAPALPRTLQMGLSAAK